ncbi:MAG: DUF4097 domain-containing protein [Ruminococcaceae bacterium]|nr:DUF4097 domain-containing protein [Oscillospiraceae bacterium]
MTMKKMIALVSVLLLILSLTGCRGSGVLKESKVYEVASEVHSLRISVSAAEFTVRHGEAFSVESNLKYLSVSEKDGVLSVLDETKSAFNRTDGKLTLYIPKDAVFEDVRITTGAAKMKAVALSAKTLAMQLGAGDVELEALDITTRADIEGGAGRITVGGGSIRNLHLETGVGALRISAALFGENELELGVGASDITLIGKREDYAVDIDKGIGAVTVDGAAVSDFGSSTDTGNSVEIESGIGAVNIMFSEK